MTAAIRFFMFILASLWPVSAAFAQKLGGAAAPDISAIRIVAAFIFCVFVAVAAAVAIRRRSQGGFPRLAPGGLLAVLSGTARPARRIDVIEARRISVHADLCLVRCDGFEYLLLCGVGGSTVLDREAPPAPNAESVG